MSGKTVYQKAPDCIKCGKRIGTKGLVMNFMTWTALGKINTALTLYYCADCSDEIGDIVQRDVDARAEQLRRGL